jgi:ABC-type polysaccharide/polyol phosphate transport system ATPase subunit
MVEMTAPLAIDIRNLRKTYQLFDSPLRLTSHVLGLDRLWKPPPGRVKTFVALDDVTFSVRRGERVAILGRNGAGKSTLLKAIAGLCKPTAGSTTVNGVVQVLAAGAQTMLAEMTGRENIESALLYGGLAGKRLEEAVADVIEFVELGEFLDQPFGNYSLGMQARTQFAVATAIHPDILLVDELLGAGDGYFSAKSAERMNALMRSGATILMVSHSPQAILQYCDRAIWLRGGSAVRDGPAADVLAAYESDMQLASEANVGAVAMDTGLHATDVFCLPPALCTSFVARHVTEAEPLEPGCQGIPVKGNRQAGLQVVSYPGQGALRITQVDWSSIPTGSGGFRVGAELRVKVSLCAAAAYTGAVRCRVLVYSLSGRRCADLIGDSIPVSLQSGESTEAVYSVPRLTLGTAHYLLSVLIEEATTDSSDPPRHDLWSMCGAIGYEPCNDSDPPNVHLDGLWRYGDAAESKPARLSAVQ